MYPYNKENAENEIYSKNIHAEKHNMHHHEHETRPHPMPHPSNRPQPRHEHKHGHEPNPHHNHPEPRPHHNHPEPRPQPRPIGPPPQHAPHKNHASRVERKAISSCLFSSTYVWLKNGADFWFYPVYVSNDSVAGFRWQNGSWVYAGFSLWSMDYFLPCK